MQQTTQQTQRAPETKVDTNHAAIFDTVFLSEPLKLATGRVISQITLRRAKVRDLKIAQRAGGDDSVTQELALIGIIAHEQLTPEDLEEMDLGDYQRVQASFRRMLGHGGPAQAGAGAAGTVVPVSAERDQ